MAIDKEIGDGLFHLMPPEVDYLLLFVRPDGDVRVVSNMEEDAVLALLGSALENLAGAECEEYDPGAAH